MLLFRGGALTDKENPGRLDDDRGLFLRIADAEVCGTEYRNWG